MQVRSPRLAECEAGNAYGADALATTCVGSAGAPPMRRHSMKTRGVMRANACRAAAHCRNEAGRTWQHAPQATLASTAPITLAVMNPHYDSPNFHDLDPVSDVSLDSLQRMRSAAQHRSGCLLPAPADALFLAETAYELQLAYGL